MQQGHKSYFGDNYRKHDDWIARLIKFLRDKPLSGHDPDLFPGFPLCGMGSGHVRLVIDLLL